MAISLKAISRMKKVYILILIIGLFGCSQNQTKNDIFISKQINGQWKTEYFNGDWKKTTFIFTFQDSNCSYLYPWGEFSTYWINGDTLYIKERIRKRRNNIGGGKLIFKFLIDSITANALFLKPTNDKTKELFNYYKDQNFEILKLIRIVKQNDWAIERIGFYSTGCFGTCPSMYLEIDSIGNLLFNGKYYTEKEGLFSGKICKKEFDIIKSEINNIQLDSLKSFYSANWTDDQTCGVTIKTKNKTYESNAYGFDKEPIELRILFHRLMELYKNIELKKDTTISEKFEFKEFQYSGYPPPPPPPPTEKENRTTENI